MAEGARGFFGDRVMETVKWCEERRDSPLAWGMEVSRRVREAGLELPSVELGEVLVSNLCFRHNTPSLWKFLDHAISTGLVSSIHVLALLSARCTKEVWTAMQLEFGKMDVTINDWDAILSNRDIHGLSKIFKVAWNASILAVLWNVWVEINRRIFEDRCISGEDLWDYIKHLSISDIMPKIMA